jgi:hypothetical protein
MPPDRATLACVVLACAACSTPESRYDWTLRRILEEPAETAYRDHERVLAELAGEDDEDVPPGLLLELGWTRLQLGDRQAAADAFAREARAHPRLRPLVDAFVAWLDAAETRSASQPASAPSTPSTRETPR